MRFVEGILMNDLKNIIKQAVEKIIVDVYNSNKDGIGKHPIILSENDLCCYLFKELYNPKKYVINTEVTEKNRHDMVIYDEKYSDYKLTINKTPKLWTVKHYQAVIELKYNFMYDSCSSSLRKIQWDLEVLSEIKEKSDLQFLIMFDMMGNHTKRELRGLFENDRFNGIIFIYVDVKNKTHYDFS